jgi:hypothetical protein
LNGVQACGSDGNSYGPCQCGASSKCVPNSTTTCSCAGGSSGAQVCASDGTYGACQCSGNGDLAVGGGDDLAVPSGGDMAIQGGPADLATPAGGSPIILSLSSNVATLIPTDQLVVTAIVTHPQGIAQIIGGQLSDVASGGTYGAFMVSTTSGSYSLTLTWSAIEQVADITTGKGGAPRVFRARFYDQAGHSTSQDLTIQLACGDVTQGICGGNCTSLDSDRNHCGTCATSCTTWSQPYPAISYGCNVGRCFLWTETQTRESCQQLCASRSPPLSCFRSTGRADYFGGAEMPNLACDTTPPAYGQFSSEYFLDLYCDCE